MPCRSIAIDKRRGVGYNMKSKLKTIFKYEADMKKIILIIFALLALICASAAAEGALSVVATDFPCYDFARQVAGDRAEVSMLIKPGVEVHAYDPSPADILSISDADLFVYVGGEGDAWADGILSGFDGDGPATLRMMDAVTPLEEEGDDHAHEAPEYDEHIWTSPVNAMAMVNALADALGAIDPDGAEVYAANATDYNERIAAIDADFRAIADASRTKLVVFADRFPFLYFVREYGLDYAAAFPSCTADTEPTPQTILALIKAVEDNGLNAVFTIEMSTQAVARTVAEETGAAILTMHSVQTVTQDEFDAGESYVSLMQKNVEALREGLK